MSKSQEGYRPFYSPMSSHLNIGRAVGNTMAKGVNWLRVRKKGFYANGISNVLLPPRRHARVRLQKSGAVLQGLLPSDNCAAPVGSQCIFVNILEDCDHMPRVAGPHQGKMKLPIIVQLAF